MSLTCKVFASENTTRAGGRPESFKTVSRNLGVIRISLQKVKPSPTPRLRPAPWCCRWRSGFGRGEVHSPKLGGQSVRGKDLCRTNRTVWCNIRDDGRAFGFGSGFAIPQRSRRLDGCTARILLHCRRFFRRVRHRHPGKWECHLERITFGIPPWDCVVGTFAVRPARIRSTLFSASSTFALGSSTDCRCYSAGVYHRRVVYTFNSWPLFGSLQKFTPLFQTIIEEPLEASAVALVEFRLFERESHAANLFVYSYEFWKNWRTHAKIIGSRCGMSINFTISVESHFTQWQARPPQVAPWCICRT
jgi:hypothetical protein